MTYHEPVLLEKSIDGLDIKSEGIYVDATFGGGGHSKEILRRLKGGKLIAFDLDEDALLNVIVDNRLILVNANFKFIKNFLMIHNAIPVDGVIADLGISSHQIDNPKRGFSTRFNTELDLRMDKKGKLNARMVLAEYKEEELNKFFFDYGELKQSHRIAEAIVKSRKTKKIVTIDDLKSVIGQYSEKGKENKFYAKVFQALRIEINKELDALKDLLIQSSEVLKTNGRLVVISYHSLEDRLVKNFMKTGNFEGIIVKDFYGHEKFTMKMITKKPIVPSSEEIKRNKRSRSALLRIAIKN